MMTFTPYSTNIYVCMPRKIAPVQISILDIIDESAFLILLMATSKTRRTFL